VLVESGDFTSFIFEWGLVYRLRHDGYRVVAPNSSLDLNSAQRFGGAYAPGGSGSTPRRYQDVLVVELGEKPVTVHGPIIAQAPVHGAPTAPNTPTPTLVSVAAAPAPPIRIPSACPSPPRTPAGRPTQRLPTIVPGKVAGFVDATQILGQTVRLCGWAADVTDRRAADSVLVSSDGRVVAGTRPTLRRPDVARVYPGLGRVTGFTFKLPLEAVNPHGVRSKLVVYAVAGGRATALAFNCSGQYHDLGC
jgi:hypothetical protein